MSKLVDVVTARALRFGLAGAIPPQAAVELAELARGDSRVLDRALGRVSLAQLDRPSPIGQRAADVLAAARSLATGDVITPSSPLTSLEGPDRSPLLSGTMAGEVAAPAGFGEPACASD